MNLKEEILSVKKYQLPIYVILDIQDKVEGYEKFQRINCYSDTGKELWYDQFRDTILSCVNYDKVFAVTITRYDRTKRKKEVSELKFGQEHQKNLENKIKYFNDLTRANLTCNKDGSGNISSVSGEWTYNNEFTTEVFIDENGATIDNICPISVVTKYLESEDIREGDKELIHEYLQTYNKPESLTLPCYEVVEDNVRVIF